MARPLSVWEKMSPQRQKKAMEDIRPLEQTGKIIDKARDASRKARAPGKRVSKNGKEYYESRKNRSDVPGTKL